MTLKFYFSMFFALCLSVICISCSQEDVVPGVVSQPVYSVHKISLDDAIQMSEKYIQTLESGTVRSTPIIRRVKSAEVCISKAVTRSVADTLFYLINYEQDMGFTLMAADDRCLPFYAISDSGNLSLADTVENKGLAMVIAMAEQDVKDAVASPSGLEIGGGISFNDFALDKKISPMLCKLQREIHQVSPWNKYCYCEDGKKTVAGCIAISVEQLCSYFGAPRMIGDYSFDWEKINNGKDPEASARFIEIISRDIQSKAV